MPTFGSTNVMPHDIERGLEAGFFSCLIKPIKVDIFMDALDVALAFSQAEAGYPAKGNLS